MGTTVLCCCPWKKREFRFWRLANLQRALTNMQKQVSVFSIHGGGFTDQTSSRDQMEENRPRVPRKEGSLEDPKTGPTRKKENQCPVDDTGDSIECSGKYCRSCTGGLIADCVALCCCPCAVVTCLGLAFVKAPWMMGKRCLGLGKKKRKCEKSYGECVVDRDGDSRMGRAEEGKSEIVTGFDDEDQNDTLSARVETEGVWLELYPLGHLSFGRVSFTGIQSQDKGN